MEAQSGFCARGVLVNTAGLSIVTSAADAWLGQGTVDAFARGLVQAERPTRPRLRRISSDPSLPVRPPIPTISVTLHQTGNSISSFRALADRRPPPRRSSVTFAPIPETPPRRPRSASPSRRNRNRDEQWLALPPLQTRSPKPKRSLTLHRSTSSPQLTSFAAAGLTFASGPTGQPDLGQSPPDSTAAAAASEESDATHGATVSDSENTKGKKHSSSRRAKTKEKVKKLCMRSRAAGGDQDAWESVYVDTKGSPNTLSVSDEQTPLASAPAAVPSLQANQPQRPHLRKSKTLGDLLRRVPNSPGPVLPNPEKLESTTKKAFAFTSTTPKPKDFKEPKFSLKPKIPITATGAAAASKSPRSSTENQRKRTQPYEAPYYWMPPDQVLAMSLQQQQQKQQRQGGTTRRSSDGVKSAPVSRVASDDGGPK
ncbi:hypothetical protein MD484_g2600, partial [Candolleomyces efflorescens]